MTVDEIDENEFFREATLRLCGTLHIEKALGKSAIKNYMDIQPGDVPATYADIDDLIKDVGFKTVKFNKTNNVL